MCKMSHKAKTGTNPAKAFLEELILVSDIQDVTDEALVRKLSSCSVSALKPEDPHSRGHDNANMPILV